MSDVKKELIDISGCRPTYRRLIMLSVCFQPHGTSYRRTDSKESPSISLNPLIVYSSAGCLFVFTQEPNIERECSPGTQSKTLIRICSAEIPNEHYCSNSSDQLSTFDKHKPAAVVNTVYTRIHGVKYIISGNRRLQTRPTLSALLTQLATPKRLHWHKQSKQASK